MTQVKQAEPSWKSAVVPAKEECVLRYLLEQRAKETPDKIFAILEDGQFLSYADLWPKAASVGAALWRRGVRSNDTVVSWLPNCKEALLTWFGANWIGAIYTPIIRHLDYLPLCVRP